MRLLKWWYYWVRPVTANEVENKDVSGLPGLRGLSGLFAIEFGHKKIPWK